MKEYINNALKALNAKSSRDEISQALVGLSNNIRALYPDETQKPIRNMLLRFELIQFPSARYSHMKKGELQSMLKAAVNSLPQSLTM